MEKSILVINNTIFYEEKNRLYLNKETGVFFLQLKDLKHRVGAFQISQLKTSKDSFANFNIRDVGINIFEIKRRKSRLLSFIKAFFKIQQVIRQHDFVYIFYPGPICQIIAFLCFLHRKQYGLYVRGEQGINTKISAFVIKKSKFVLTISPEFTKRISLINLNSYTIRPMIGLKENDIIRKREILFVRPIRILYVGRLVFDKGLFELLEALKVLIGKNRKLSLNLVGGGTDYDGLISYIKSNSLEEYVSFHGMVSDKDQLKNIYKESDIFILPSYHEGFPRVLYEAMMMHLPIVTTFVGTIGFLMKDKVNCLKINPKDVSSIVMRIEDLIDDPKLAQKIADEGNRTIISYLENKKQDHATQLHDLLEKITV